MNLQNTIKRIDLYKKAQECLNEIQLLDEQDAGAINVPDEITPFILEIHIAALKRKEIQKLSNHEMIIPSENF